MKDRISALMDGELDDKSAAELIRAARGGGEAADAWRTYHLISDAMRDTRLLSSGFQARLAQRLAAEPAVLSPVRRPLEPRRWLPVAAAAGAAVALVGWVAFAPQQPGPAPIAKAPPAIAAPIPSAANDYLLAHQVFSTRISLQGMYVRSAPDEAVRK